MKVSIARSRARSLLQAVSLGAALSLAASTALGAAPIPGYHASEPAFQTSDRCLACHNDVISSSGADVSIGFDWRTSVMANAGRDPYWQASIRRETLEHSSSVADIQDDCTVCHMPIARYHAHLDGKLPQPFSYLAVPAELQAAREYADGVSCAVCHQISADNLGHPDSYNGGFIVAPANAQGVHPEYGPFAIDPAIQRIMRSSTGGFQPTQGAQIRSSELCATCHTLITRALGPDGQVIGSLPEQVPYQEWRHSDFSGQQSCQSCHMPAIAEAVPIARVLGVPREGARHHQFIGGNFFLQRLLARYHDTLDLTPSTDEFAAAAARTTAFLQSKSARLLLAPGAAQAGRLAFTVTVQNLTGHKLPTAYPSRRAWLHVRVQDAQDRVVFESGALHPDGSIQGNVNDRDPLRFEPHFSQIEHPEQVQIYESILGDRNGAVTTGLLNAVDYLKDNRLLPRGFDKRTADAQIAVHGAALQDPRFIGGQDTVGYSIALNGNGAPYRIDAELLYEPIGYRWANNLKPYGRAVEPRRFTQYYDAMGAATATTLARVHSVVH
jgi:hypothetical protein